MVKPLLSKHEHLDLHVACMHVKAESGWGEEWVLGVMGALRAQGVTC